MRSPTLLAILTLSSLGAGAPAQENDTRAPVRTQERAPVAARGEATDRARRDRAMDRMLHEIRRHEVRLARIHRLQQIFRDRGDDAKVRELDRLLVTERGRHRDVMSEYRDRLGPVVRDVERRVDRVRDRRTDRDVRGPGGAGNDRRGDRPLEIDRRPGQRQPTDRGVRNRRVPGNDRRGDRPLEIDRRPGQRRPTDRGVRIRRVPGNDRRGDRPLEIDRRPGQRRPDGLGRRPDRRARPDRRRPDVRRPDARRRDGRRPPPRRRDGAR